MARLSERMALSDGLAACCGVDEPELAPSDGVVVVVAFDLNISIRLSVTCACMFLPPSLWHDGVALHGGG
jgi:hypothetical protein